MKSGITLLKLWIVFQIGFVINIAQIIYQAGNGDTSIYAIGQAGFGWESQLGRWLIQYVSKMRNNIVLPIYIQLLSLVFLSISVLLICDIFELSSKRSIFAASCLFLGQPFVSAVMIIYYCADAYSLSVLLSVLSAWLIMKKETKYRWIGAVACLVVSLSLYQSNIAMAGILLLLWCIKETLRAGDTFHTCLKRILLCSFTGMAAICLYMVLLKLYLKYSGLSLADYKGMSSMGHIDIKASCAKMIEFIKSIYFDNARGIVGYHYWPLGRIVVALNIIFIIAFMIFVCLYVLRRKKEIGKQRILLGAFLICLLPFMWSAIVFMAPEVSFTALLIPHLPLLYVLILWIAEKWMHHHKMYLGVIFLIYMIATQYLFYTNEVYYSRKLSDNQAYALATDINSRLYARDDWAVGMKIAIIGDFDTFTGEPDYLSIYDKSNKRFWTGYGGQAGWIGYLNERLGVYYQSCSYDEYTAILESKDWADMESYPGKNSIRTVHDITVVKLSD